MIYKWGEGYRFSLDAQKVGEHLNRLHGRNGELTAEIVLKDASRPNSPIHDAFEWDDQTAAYEYRLVLARKLLAAIVFVPNEQPDAEPLRFYVHIQNGESYYTTLIAAMSDEQKRAQVLGRALQELESWRKHYQAYEELAEVFAAAAKTRELVTA